MSANIPFEAHICSVIVFYDICILLILVFAYSPTLLTPLPQSISLKKPARGSGIRQHYPSCFAMLQQSPGNSSIYRRRSAGRTRGWWCWGGIRSSIEWGSGRWRAGEGGFFGKGANPITGSGAALVSLAALNSHFNSLFFPPPVPSLSISASSCYFFSYFFLIMAHTHTL